jgi:hypothetical protein
MIITEQKRVRLSPLNPLVSTSILMAFLVLKSSAAPHVYSNSILLSSDQGQPLQGSAGVGAPLFRSAVGDQALVVVGQNGKIFRSIDGIAWYPQNSGTTNTLNGIVYGQGQWVAVGDQGTIVTSPDARQWTPQNLSTSIWFSAVTYARGLYVAVGSTVGVAAGYPRSPQSAIWTSPDGIMWTDRKPLYPDGLMPLNDVIYVPEKLAFYAVGEDLAMGSLNGMAWNDLSRGGARGVSARRVTYGNGLFLAVGQYAGGIFTSTDGVNWVVNWTVHRLRNAQGQFQEYMWWGTTYFDGAFWIIGEDIFRSTDTQNWQVVSGVTPGLSLSEIDNAGDRLLAISFSGNILQSGSRSAPPRFQATDSRVQSDGTFAFTLETPPGSTVAIDSSPDLRNWSTLQVMTNWWGHGEVTDPGAKASPTRFYRALTR